MESGKVTPLSVADGAAIFSKKQLCSSLLVIRDL